MNLKQRLDITTLFIDPFYIVKYNDSNGIENKPRIVVKYIYSHLPFLHSVAMFKCSKCE